MSGRLVMEGSDRRTATDGGCGRSWAPGPLVSLLRPEHEGSHWREAALRTGERYSTRSRRRRAELFLRSLPVRPSDRVLDLGGCDGTYMALDLEADVYVADVDGAAVEAGAREHGFTPVVVPSSGRLPYPDGYFDASREFARRARLAQRRFVEEVRRLGKRYFVQTPNRYFPVESHTWLPGLLVALPRRWQIGLVDHANHWWPKTSVVDFHLLNERELRLAFPEATIVRERFLGDTKSLIALGAEPRAADRWAASVAAREARS